MTDFFAALALVLFIEGIVYAAFGPLMKQNMMRLLALPTSTIRAAGLITAGVGLVLLWLIRG